MRGEEASHPCRCHGQRALGVLDRFVGTFWHHEYYLEVKKCERRPGINKLLTLLDLTKVSGLFRRVAILFESAFPRTLSLVCRVYRSFTLFSACS